MKNLLLTTTILFSVNSFGSNAHLNNEVLTCVTTEPFISYTLDPHEGTLVYKEAIMNEVVEVSNNAVFKAVNELVDQHGNILHGSVYKVVDSKTGKRFIDLKFDNKGNNGMSEEVYPFTAYFVQESESMEFPLYGGCYSTNTPPQNPNFSIWNLKNL